MPTCAGDEEGGEPTGCLPGGMTDVAQAGTAAVTDNPITRASDDLLQRGDVAAALAGNLRYVDAWKGHVVGILGPWGSGKTSLVNLIREQLAVAPELAVLDFNPWTFSGAEQLVDSFFAEYLSGWRPKEFGSPFGEDD
jgi:predicted KAP-like P-loop ATPase